MIFNIITTLPEIFTSIIKTGLIQTAISKKIIKINLFNPKIYNKIKFKPYGGGGNLIMKAKPFSDIIYKIKENNNNKDIIIINVSPKGKNITQNDIKNISRKKEIIILCGRYKGIDTRINTYINKKWSIGNYITTSGEIATIIILTAILRLIPGFLKNSSIKNNSFTNELFDYPNYTKPKIINKINIPNILLSGNHKKIKTWREKKSLKNTWYYRPDLIKKIKFKYI